MVSERIYCALLFIPAIIASLAFAFSLAGNIYCSTIHFSPTTTTNTTTTAISNTGDPLVLSLGVFYYHKVSTTKDSNGNVIIDSSSSSITTDNSCVDYPKGTRVDGKWKTAKAFSIVAPVIGGFFLFWTWFVPCYRPNQRRWRMGGMIYITVGILQSFTLVFLASNACRDNPLTTIFGTDNNSNVNINGYDYKCELGPGSKLNITSIVLWLVLGCALLVVPPPDPWPTTPVETQTVTYQQTALPDGTVAVVETNVVKGTLVQPTTTTTANNNNNDDNNKVLEEIEAAKET